VSTTTPPDSAERTRIYNQAQQLFKLAAISQPQLFKSMDEETRNKNARELLSATTLLCQEYGFTISIDFQKN
jgi:hypothetical protein